MKITCPLCGQEPDSPDVKGICEHLTDYHKWENILINEYAKLLFKIHEKIEVFGQALDHHYTNDDVIQELKSLLESEKE